MATKYYARMKLKLWIAASVVAAVAVPLSAPASAHTPHSYPVLCQGNPAHTTLACEENPPHFWPAHQFIVVPIGGHHLYTDLPTDPHHASFTCRPIGYTAPTTIYGCEYA